MNRVPLPAKKAVRQWQRKIFLALFWQRSLPATGWTAFLVGGIILLRNLCWPGTIAVPLDAIGLGCLFLAVLSAAFLAGQKVPSSRQLLVWLDYGNACGGLLISALEVDTRAWHKPTQDIPLPCLSLPWRKYLPVFLAGTAFLLLAALLPEKYSQPKQHFSLDISPEAAELLEKLQVLTEESLLPDSARQEMQNQLQELQAHNDARAAAETYCLLHNIEKNIIAYGSAAASSLHNQAVTQAALASITGMLSALPDDTPRLSSAKEQLAELLRQLSGSDACGSNLPSELASLDAETLRQLAQQLRQSSSDCQRRLARLVQAKLAQQRQLQSQAVVSECANARLAANNDLAEWLAQNAPAADDLNALCCPCPGPGAGDCTYGRADAPLNFTGQTGESLGQFQEHALSANRTPAESVALLRLEAPPAVGPDEQEAAQAGLLRGQYAESEVRQTRLFPEHRAAVKRYFKAAASSEQ